MVLTTLPFAAFAVAQVGTPGPANMALMATGAAQGFRASLPFALGVTAGKQLLIWPLGLGLMTFLADAPLLFAVLKWAAIGYICWLAWRVAQMRLTPGTETRRVGFRAGLIVHPLNPKAWAMAITGLTSFVPAGASAFQATLMVALTLGTAQLILHPLWAFAGDRLARVLASTRYERALMITLALLTVASVLHVLLLEGATP
ncbi:LysE family translocator [Pseudaestuariivita sp.]|uniref:LysE family translocator n=1 Tax=Pseudaestuariivita sp. TaxID=2211669 RepID=UPI004059C620